MTALAASAALLLSACAPAQPPTTTQPAPTVTIAVASHGRTGLPAEVDPDLPKIFSDDFDGKTLDDAKWSTCFHFGYADSGDSQFRCTLGNAPQGVNEPDNVTLEKGIARLMAIKEPRAFGGKMYGYTFGMLSTLDKFSFTRGYVEIRARLSGGRGMWPALWLMPASKNWPPEIDIAECLGREPRLIHGTLHYTGTVGKPLEDGLAYKNSADCSNDFHVYAVSWTAQEIVWFFDGIPYHRVTHDIPNEPMYVLMTQGFGAPGSWGGAIDGTTPFPNLMQIDYVRVYGR